MIKTILFDLDGVLVDACDWHYQALNLALETSGYPTINYYDHLNKYNGRPTKIKLQMMGFSPETIEHINTLKQSFTHNIISDYGYPLKEKIELHQYLRDTGIKSVCVTNSIRATAEHMLKITGQFDYIDFIVSNEDVVYNKPSPDCYNFAIDTLGLLPSQCLCVEDSPLGLEAARASKAGHIWAVSNSSQVTKNNLISFLKDIS